MNSAELVPQIQAIAAQRQVLLDLLDDPKLGPLKIDVQQALEELDELVEECHETFPEAISM